MSRGGAERGLISGIRGKLLKYLNMWVMLFSGHSIVINEIQGSFSLK